MIGLTSHHSYYYYPEACDMRKGFDGLCGMVKDNMRKNPTDGSVYIFINKRRTRMKLLVWEYGGFMMYYKRLEKGTFELPIVETESGSISIDWETLVLMLRGIKLGKIIRKKRHKVV